MVHKTSAAEESITSSHSLERKRKHEKIEQHKPDLQNLELQALAIDNGVKLMQNYEAVCSSSTVDDHARLIFKDYFLRIAAQSVASPIAHDEHHCLNTTKLVAWNLNYYPTDSQLSHLSSKIRQRYEEIYARSPPQKVDGYDEVKDELTYVDSYSERDRPMMERIIKEFMAAQEDDEEEDSDSD